MPGAVESRYVRLTRSSASSLVGETRFLSAGVAGTDFKGSLNFAANTLNAGDGCRIFAWGSWLNNDQAPGTAQVRVYFNPGAALNNPIADTGAGVQLPAGEANPVEWSFFAQITIRTTGQNGTGWCDSYLFNVINYPVRVSGFNTMSGSGAFNIDTTMGNDLELTAAVVGGGVFRLEQCSIERLISP